MMAPPFFRVFLRNLLASAPGANPASDSPRPAQGAGLPALLEIMEDRHESLKSYLWIQ